MTAVRFQILGPVEARVEGRALALRGPKQRALLAMLLIDAGVVVSRSRLIEGIWGNHLPADVEHALDAQVSTLRQTLATASGLALERRSPGYVLAPDPEAVDVSRFQRLVADGRQQLADGDAAGAAATLREGLAQWHGAALADVQSAPFAAAVADDLERRRVDAVEDRVEADLASGHGADVVAELEALVAVHPYRERLIAALATALYRAGQQTRALEVIAAARRDFAAELGLQPGQALLDLERQILNHDPGLSVVPVVSAARSAPTPPLPPLPTAPRRRRGWLAAAVAALVVATSIAIIQTSGNAQNGDASSPQEPHIGAPEPRSPDLSAAGVSAIDVASDATRTVATLSADPTSATAGRDGVWISQASDSSVSLIEPDSGDVLARVPIADAPGALAAGGGAVWVASTVGGSITRIDQDTRSVTQHVRVGGTPAAVTFAFGSVWVADQSGRRLVEIDPSTGDVTGSASLADRPTALAAGRDAIWVASHDSGTVAVVDPKSLALVATVNVGSGPTSVVAGAGSVWVANNEDATVSRLDSETGRVEATIPVNSGPAALAFTSKSLWVAGEHATTVAVVDPTSNAVTGQVPVHGNPKALAAYRGEVWVGAGGTADRRGGTLTMLTETAPPTVDPGFQMQISSSLFLGLAYDGLVAINHTAGPRGLQLVPDLADGLPTSTSGDTVFAFRLRPGIEYSDGVPVRAGDFRRAFIRLLRSHGGSGFFNGLVGAQRCSQHPADCTLTRGVVTDNRLRTVAFHLTAPDPDFLFRLTAMNYASPVPAGTPMTDMGMSPLPGTGPYQIVHADSSTVRFERNPNFHEWSYAAQPDGQPDAIVWRFGLSRAAEVRAVRSGAADWTLDGIPSRMWAQVKNHNAAQLHINSIPETDFMIFNPFDRPFDNVLARRALNLAIDRAAVVHAYGGPAQATPTCQIVPTGDPARVPYCPYTQPGRHGFWTAPDVAKARRLVARSGTEGATVRVLGLSDGNFPPPAASRVTAQALRQIGYRVHLSMVTWAEYKSLPSRTRAAIDVVPFGWWEDFPSASVYLRSMLPCLPLDKGEGCEQALREVMDRATRREARGLADHEAIWSEVDRMATRAALTVPLVNPRAVELTSTRLTGYQANPLTGFMPALASVR